MILTYLYTWVWSILYRYFSVSKILVHTFSLICNRHMCQLKNPCLWDIYTYILHDHRKCSKGCKYCMTSWDKQHKLVKHCAAMNLHPILYYILRLAIDGRKSLLSMFTLCSSLFQLTFTTQQEIEAKGDRKIMYSGHSFMGLYYMAQSVMIFKFDPFLR